MSTEALPLIYQSSDSAFNLIALKHEILIPFLPDLLLNRCQVRSF